MAAKDVLTACQQPTNDHTHPMNLIPRGAAVSDLRLLCYVRGQGTQWEGICVDLDIAVQAESQKEAFLLLETSVLEYLRSLENEEPEVRQKLLNRRAPFWLRARLALDLFWHTLRRRRGDREHRAGFDMPCPA